MNGCGGASSLPTQAASAVSASSATSLPTPDKSTPVPAGGDTTSFASTLGSELQSIEAQIQALMSALQGSSTPSKFAALPVPTQSVGQLTPGKGDISQAISSIQQLLNGSGTQSTAPGGPSADQSFTASQTALVTPPTTNLDLSSTATVISSFYKVVDDRTAFVGKVQQAIAADAQRNGSPNQEAEYQVTLMQSSIAAIKSGTDQLAALGSRVTPADLQLFARGVTESLQNGDVSPDLAQAVSNATAGV